MHYGNFHQILDKKIDMIHYKMHKQAATFSFSLRTIIGTSKKTFNRDFQ